MIPITRTRVVVVVVAMRELVFNCSSDTAALENDEIKLISSTGCIVRTLNISRTEQRFGRACGYISASCYIFGRFFQISKNFVRKSTKGISLFMFCNVALANMLYAAAILLQKESKEERMNSFTFLLGSLGTIACDLVIFIQSRVYRRSVREE